MSKLHVHVVTEAEGPLPRRSLLGHWARAWVESGVRVTIGPTALLEADIGIMHVDLTSVPLECTPLNPQGKPLLNERVRDISKRRVSYNLLTPECDYCGPVIVKTDANCFGSREFSQLSRFDSRRMRRKLAKYLPWQYMRELPSGTYPVLDSLSAVPAWVWERGDLVVERFLPEIEDGAYVLRSWLFFGDRDYVVKIYGSDPVVKAGNVRGHEILDEVPESLRVQRAGMGMDFGKFDYVEVGGQAILIDANKTPTAASAAPRLPLMSVGDALFGYLQR